MERFLFKVESTFLITNKVVLLPGLSADGPVVRRGDNLKLVREDGEIINTKVREFALINRKIDTGQLDMRIPIMLDGTVKKDQVPIGTDVYLSENDIE